MAVSRLTTWQAGNTLTADALNAEFNNQNQTNVAFPLTNNVSAAGYDVAAANLTGTYQLTDNVVSIDKYSDSLATAISTIGSTVTTLIINQNVNVTANATVPSTLSLLFLGQGKLTISVGVTATINGPIQAEPRQIFAGSGVVTFASNTKMPPVYPQWWGALVDGSTDDAPAWQLMLTAISGGGEVLVTRGTHKLATALTFANNRVAIKGLSGNIISKEFSGDLFTISSNVLRTVFTDLWIDGNGDTYTGDIFVLSGGTGYVDINRIVVVDGPDTIVEMAPDSGSPSWIRNSSFTIHSSVVASGAVVKNTGADTQASPRFWTNCFGLSSTYFYRGTGLQSFYAAEIYSNGFHFTGDTSGGCTMRGCRMALYPQATNSLTLRGENMLVTDCNIGGDFTIASDFDNSKFVNNLHDTAYTMTNNAPLTSIVESPDTPFYKRGNHVIDTASLPAASAAMNGTILIENAGAGNRNLIVYAGGERFRIDGGANV
jgi:hypothetical protein